MSEKRSPRWVMEAGAWTHDTLVIICVAGIVLALGILLFGGPQGAVDAGRLTP
jgi:hypothetical protein